MRCGQNSSNNSNTLIHLFTSLVYLKVIKPERDPQSSITVLNIHINHKLGIGSTDASEEPFHALESSRHTCVRLTVDSIVNSNSTVSSFSHGLVRISDFTSRLRREFNQIHFWETRLDTSRTDCFPG